MERDHIPTEEELIARANAPLDINAPGARWEQRMQETLSTHEGRVNYINARQQALNHRNEMLSHPLEAQTAEPESPTLET